MDCDRALDLLHDEDGRPPAGELADHLLTCPGCRRLRQIFLRSRPILRSLPPAPAPPDFVRRLQDRIERLERARRRRRRAGRVLVGVGSGTACAVLLGLLLSANARPWGEGAAAWLRGASASSGTMLVRVVRPLPSVDPAEQGPFGTPEETAPRIDPATAVPWSSTFALSADAQQPESESRRAWSGWLPPPPYDAPPPVLVAGPSWTFVAAPVSLRFVSTASASQPSAAE
ncbi:MAG: anti-sigma factor [Gemmatimonadota bacterium]